MSNTTMIVKVGPISYKLKVVDEIGDGDQQYDGWIDYANARIEIAKGLDPQFERAVVLHEVMHAVLKHAGQDSKNEALITALSYSLLDLIRNNPELIHYLIQSPLVLNGNGAHKG